MPPHSPVPFPLILLLPLFFQAIWAQQINLGSFNLNRNPFSGDFQLGLGQGANILGFGADRELGLNLGPGRFGARTDNGLLLGGHRFGLDSHLGYREGQGVDLGSFLNLFQPVGQLLNRFRPPPPPRPAPLSPPFPSWPSPAQPDGLENGPVQPPPPMPTLIPSSAGINSARNWPSASTRGGSQEQFPSSVGEGWKSGVEEGEERAVDPFERARGGEGRESLPWSVGRPAEGVGEGSWRGAGGGGGRRVTTEGQFRGGDGAGIGATVPDGSKRDGDTRNGGGAMEEGEKPRKGGLPIPSGLEPLKLK